MARVAENLSATTKAKKMKHTVSENISTVLNKSPSVNPNKMMKKKRGTPISRRQSVNETPRSTTPLSSTSNSSRPKTPATPATRSTTRSISKGLTYIYITNCSNPRKSDIDLCQPNFSAQF